MLSTLVRFSLRFYGIVIAVALIILGYGSYRFATAGLDIFPEFAPKRVIIQSEAPGFSAEQVEVLVTRQIESSISGLVGMESVRSESIQGLSIITATFKEKTDVYRNRQLISERLASSSAILPQGITPVAIPLSSSSATVLTLGLTSESKDLMALRSLIDWTVVPRLLAIPGVADVNVFGGEIGQLQLQVDPLQLQRFNLSLNDIIEAAGQVGVIQGGGFEPGMKQRPTQAPIENEANNGLKNDHYTVAMARTSAPHSASAQFFINTADNDFLNHTAPTASGWGYAVFGQVVAGQDVVDEINGTKTGRKGMFDDVPKEDVVIEKVVLLEDGAQHTEE